MNDMHRWFRGHVADALLELLVEDDARRFDAHAAECAECSALLARSRTRLGDAWEGRGHVPLVLLARWAGEPNTVPAALAASVRGHLSACEACRADLAALGAPGANVLGPIGGAPASPRVPRWRDWLLGGGAGAVAAVVAMLAFGPRPPIRSDAQPPPATVPPQASAPAAPAVPLPALSPLLVVGEPVHVAARLRGGRAVSTRALIRPELPYVPLTLPELFLADDVTISLELIGPEGRVLARRELRAAQAARPGGVVLDTRTLRPGPHLLRASWRDPVLGVSRREFPLDLRVPR